VTKEPKAEADDQQQQQKKKGAPMERISVSKNTDKC